MRLTTVDEARVWPTVDRGEPWHAKANLDAAQRLDWAAVLHAVERAEIEARNTADRLETKGQYATAATMRNEAARYGMVAAEVRGIVRRGGAR